MNKKGEAEEIIIYAGAFLILFFIGGSVGVLSLPEFYGRFFISGLIVGVFGTGAGAIIIKVILQKRF